MEASSVVAVPPSGLDTMVLGVVAPDDDIRHRVRAVGLAAGLDIRLACPDAQALVEDADARELTAVIVSTGAAETADVVALLKESLTGVSIVLVPDPAEPRGSLRRLLDSGADGIVLHGQIEEALVGTLIAVQGGQVVMPREMAPRTRAALSFREKQILGLVVMGFTNAAIANQLFLAESTVKSHLSSAFTKLGVRSRHEAAALLADPEQMGLGVLTIARD